MTYKIMITALILSLTISAFGQKAAKKDIYIYFQPDSAQSNYKTTLGDKQIYNYGYVSADGRKKYSLMLFSALNKDVYCVSDSGFFKIHEVLSYRNLEKIKGLISDTWDPKKTSFKRVFIVEKMADHNYKIIQVQSYYAFNSNGVQIKKTDQ